MRIRLRVYNAVFQNFVGSRTGNQISLQAYTNSLIGTVPPAQDLDWHAGQLPADAYRIVLNTTWANTFPPTICPTVETDLVVTGTPVPPTPGRPAPTLSAWALGLVAAVLALLGGLAARRRSA